MSFCWATSACSMMTTSPVIEFNFAGRKTGNMSRCGMMLPAFIAVTTMPLRMRAVTPQISRVALHKNIFGGQCAAKLTVMNQKGGDMRWVKTNM